MEMSPESRLRRVAKRQFSGRNPAFTPSTGALLDTLGIVRVERVIFPVVVRGIAATA
jgi:hypothetical protein